MDGCPLGLGLVVEDKPTEFSCLQLKFFASFLYHLPSLTLWHADIGDESGETLLIPR